MSYNNRNDCFFMQHDKNTQNSTALLSAVNLLKKCGQKSICKRLHIEL
ncbi:unknown [[Mannheimia] succiniciproducens MBEL55E]|uniref:Uncharacterized protein n=1 Tax=Mannheimia succiniciproducens (strain KCTC 0769BP / MBEL55E) TaxID=221988 RepID=Q65SH0_MANSM|nr:unknown [[Mannheimia] succiniciproducens MBEL55E]